MALNKQELASTMPAHSLVSFRVELASSSKE